MSLCSINTLAGAALAEGFCAGLIPLAVSQPRSIHAIGPTDFLVLERGTGSVVVAEDLDGDGIPESRRTLASVPTLNHGLEVTSTHLYASESSAVYRWPYDPVTKAVVGNQETVVFNIDADGKGGAPFGHTTRTLVIDQKNEVLYVSVGSGGNIDADSFRSRIRRFPLSDPGLFPINFLTGEVFVDGLRNEVGMTMDSGGTLWGVGNSADRLMRSDLGGDIHNNNPSEEMHKLELGQNYGYPFCWREYEMELGLGVGTSWAWPDSGWPNAVNLYTDELCRTQFDQPIFHMPAHSAPLGIEFYHYPETLCGGVIPFPSWMDGYAFIAYHGSWNRDIPTGYKVVYVEVTEDGEVIGDAVDLLTSECCEAKWDDGTRPVDVSFDECGRLLVSSDGSRTSEGQFYGDKVIRVENMVEPAIETNQPTATPPIADLRSETTTTNVAVVQSTNPTISPNAVSTCSTTPCSTGSSRLMIGPLVLTILSGFSTFFGF